MRGERRPCPDLGTLPFDRGEQSSFFAANVGAGALDRFQVEGKSAAANVFPEPSGLTQFENSSVDALEGVGIFRPDVKNPHGRATVPACRDHSEEDAVRLLFHEVAIDVGARITLVRVTDDILDFSFGLTAGKPFQVQGKTGPAAAA